MKHLRQLLNFAHVTRYHTVRGNGADQTIGQHSFGVLLIIMQLNPNPSANLIRAAVYHDLAEGKIGDAPSTAKWMFPSIQKAYLDAEERIEFSFGLKVTLTQEDADWLIGADMLELLLYSEYRASLKDADHEWTEVVVRAKQWFEERRNFLNPKFYEVIYEDTKLRS